MSEPSTAPLGARTFPAEEGFRPPGNVDWDSTADFHRRGARRHRVRIFMALAFSVVSVALTTIGALDVFVWSPMASVPGMPLEQIAAEMAAVGEGNGAVTFRIWAIISLVAAVVLPLLVIRRAPGEGGSARSWLPQLSTSLSVSIAGTAMIAANCAFIGVSSIGVGMAVADTFDTSADGGYSIAAQIGLVTLPAVGAMIALAVIQATRLSRSPYL